MKFMSSAARKGQIDDHDDPDAISVVTSDHNGGNVHHTISGAKQTGSLHSVSSEHDQDERTPSIADSSAGESSNESSRHKNVSGTFSREEARLVKGSKLLVLVVLFIAAALCSISTFIVLRNGENQEFEAKVHSYAEEIIRSSRTTANTIFATMDSLSITVMSHALDRGSKWPAAQLPYYSYHAEKFFGESNAQYLSLSPIVREEDRKAYESYAVANQEWTKQGNPAADQATSIPPFIYDYSTVGNPAPKPPTNEFHVPVAQIYPVLPSFVNFDLFTFAKGIERVFYQMKELRVTSASGIANIENGEVVLEGDPFSYVVAPIFEDLDRKGPIVAFFTSILPYSKWFENILPEGETMYVVLRSSCGETATFLLNGGTPEFVAFEDVHNPTYDYLETSSPFDALTVEDVKRFCSFTTSIYPTKKLHESSSSYRPLFFTFVVGGIFILTSLVFVVYDILVQRRQARTETSAERTNALVSSLFPAQVRDRIIAEAEQPENCQIKSSGLAFSSKSGGGISSLLSTKPIAELFPRATVMFGDICGFTSWSSVREPSQVFTLLEQIYGSYDIIAKKRKIFKVETIGDCYVAAAGLPEARKDHAVAMARFAHECRAKMNVVVKRLEVVLGPGTADLSMRFGLHSGPVTAGVLRGEKSRFQLFGDTVNTASRIESTGTRNMIHMSKETAEQLVAAGRIDWVKEREGTISAKGKGTIQTFWLILGSDALHRTAGSVASEVPVLSSDSASGTPVNKKDKMAINVRVIQGRTDRLIEWNVDVLHRQLQKIVAMRDSRESKKSVGSENSPDEMGINNKKIGETVLSEVQEIIPLSDIQGQCRRDHKTVDIGERAMSQLRCYVSTVASMYHDDNPFHNFEHASHVTQSVTKLLSRIVTADDIDYKDMQYKKKQEDEELHKQTFGITSDPLIQFACAFSSLIHDVDHTGLPNAQLVAEGHELAHIYQNQSVAEQNSVDLAWELMMEPQYKHLRACIYQTQEELERFRHLVVNSVMATDIVDKELGALRKKRWAKAFAADNTHDDAISEKHRVNRKATIVIEHIIQASDVSHTMQHWHVYVKWNEKLFHEMRRAYKSGRAEKDPAEGWYQGELGFFDFYLIPLAKKLKECGVFGVSSDEYLNYALANRAEWEDKGRDIVKGYLEREIPK